MGLSSKKTKTKTTENSTAVTTPNVPSYLQDAYAGLGGKIAGYMNADAGTIGQTVAPASALQQQAFSAARGLGGWQGLLSEAAQGVRGLGQANLGGPAAQATGQGYEALGYRAPTIGPAAPATTHLADMPEVSAAQGYDVVNASSQGYDAAQATAARIAAMQKAEASSLLDGLDRYYNPYERQVIDTSAADFDADAGRVRAAQALSASRGGAFGGSRYGVQEATTEGELARARGSLLSGLRQQGFDRATTLSGQDADRRQAVSLFNTGQENTRTLEQARLEQETGLFNTSETNNARQFGAAEANTSARINAQMATDRNRYAAEANNENNRFRTSLLGDLARFNASELNNNSRFNATEDNTMTRYGAGLTADAERFRAEAGNRAAEFGSSLGADLARFNATENNAMTRFNAGQLDAAEGRRLQASSLLGDLAGRYGSQSVADISALLDAGQAERGIDQAQRDAYPAYLARISALLGGLPIDALSGRTVNTTGTGRTTETSPRFKFGWSFKDGLNVSG